MANEFVHKSQGTTLTQSEYENIDAHVCNSQATGDLIYASSSSQLSRLAITNDRVLVSSGGVPTWSATLPAITLGGTVSGNQKTISDVGSLTVTNVGGNAETHLNYIRMRGTRVIGGNDDIGSVTLSGGLGVSGHGGYIKVYGTGAIELWTMDGVGGDTRRALLASGAGAQAMTWYSTTHVGMVMGDHLTLYITDTDGATEGDIWYDASENKLKFYNGAAVETITSSA